MIRLVYQRGEFTPEQTTLVATALFWFAFSLPTNGLFLLLTRTFFSLQRPWLPTAIAAGNLVVTALGALALYHLGVGGIVAATAIATTASVVAQCVILRRDARRPRAAAACSTRGIRIALAAAALAGGQLRRLGPARRRPRAAACSARSSRSASALALGGLVYLGAAKLLRIAELEQIMPPGAAPRARCSASARYLLGRRSRSPLLVGFAWLGRLGAARAAAAAASRARRRIWRPRCSRWRS